MDHTIDFEGRVTRYTYDAFGRLEQERFYNDIFVPEGTPGQTIDYTLDALGRTREINDSLGGIWTSVYDTRDRLTQEVSPQGIVNYAYNDLDQLTRTFTSKTTLATDAVTDTNYLYDALGRLEKVSVVERNDALLATAEDTIYTYDAAGNLDTVTLPNGVVSDYIYDELNRLTELKHERSDLTLIARYKYELALDGKRTAVNEFDTAGQTARIDWLYDELGRLTQEKYDDFVNDSLDFTADYLFDLVGNRLQKGSDTDGDQVADEIVDYTYDDNDRMLTETKNAAGTADDRHTVYSYGLGNDRTEQTKKTVHQGLNAAGAVLSTTDYSYNLQGRLETVAIDADNDGKYENQITYAYNPAGIRVYEKVEEDTNDDGTVDVTTERHFVIDNQNATGYAQVLEEKSSPTALPQRTYSLGLDVLYQADGAASPEFFIYDGHGSNRMLVDALGFPLSGEIYAFDAFGNPIGNWSPDTAGTSILYSGEFSDRLTGFQYLRSRYLRLATGTFTRSDSFFGNLNDPQSLHKYLYVHGDPINMVDPTGEFGFAFGLGGFFISLSIRFQDAATRVLPVLSYLTFRLQFLAHSVLTILPHLTFRLTQVSLALTFLEGATSAWLRNAEVFPDGTVGERFARGTALEGKTPANLGGTVEAIDDLRNGHATSVKTHSVATQARLLREIEKDLDALDGIETRRLEGTTANGRRIFIPAGSIRSKSLLVGIPANQTGYLTPAFRQQITNLATRANTLIRIVPVRAWRR